MSASAGLDGIADFPPGASFRRMLTALLKQERRVFYKLSLASGVGALLALAPPLAVQYAMDDAVPNRKPQLLVLLAVAVCVLTFNSAWVGWIELSTQVLFKNHAEARCLRSLLGRLLRAPFAKIQEKDSGWALETLRKAAQIVDSAATSVVSLLTRALTSLSSFVLLAIWFPALAAACALGMTLMITASMWIAHVESTRRLKLLQASGDQVLFLHTLLRSLTSVRALGATRRFGARWQTLLEREARAELQVTLAELDRSQLLDAGQRFLAVAVNCILAFRCVAGVTSVGVMMTSTLLLGNVLQSFVSISGTLLEFVALRSQFARVDELIRLQPDRDAGQSVVAQSAGAQSAGAQSAGALHQIRLDRVFFRYPEASRWVLQDYSCHFEIEGFHRISAASGAGKTTLLRLIAGLLTPQSGAVRIGGREVADVSQLVLYSPQLNALLEGSLGDNLRLLSGRDLEHVMAVAEATGLSQLVRTLPMGLDTLITAGGANLSAGQRQLVILTAAFASDKPILLLDEPTSQLDSTTRAAIQWEWLARSKTVLLVEHH
ncbi:MAG TPA: ATP-binding cassette domain-containing protein [Polyangiaceae bacterium]|nr:ATP-binding cassette domain-containing protein [Polyangiaceae bacterium]